MLIVKMKAFGTAGHAGDYECKSLEEMKKWYEEHKYWLICFERE